MAKQETQQPPTSVEEVSSQQSPSTATTEETAAPQQEYSQVTITIAEILNAQMNNDEPVLKKLEFVQNVVNSFDDTSVRHTVVVPMLDHRITIEVSSKSDDLRTFEPCGVKLQLDFDHTPDCGGTFANTLPWSEFQEKLEFKEEVYYFSKNGPWTTLVKEKYSFEDFLDALRFLDTNNDIRKVELLIVVPMEVLTVIRHILAKTKLVFQHIVFAASVYTPRRKVSRLLRLIPDNNRVVNGIRL